MLAETPATQCSHGYSAVSASLINPLPDSSYLPFCHTHYLILRMNTSLVAGRTIYKAAPLETNTSLLHRFTAESSLELMSLEEYCSTSRKLNNKQRQVVMFLLLFKLSSQLPFVSFSFSLSLSSICSLSQSSL